MNSEEQNGKPLAFSYLRFSTPEQQRGDSFRRQADAAARYARENGLRLDHRSFYDLGVSAFRGDNLTSGKLGEFREAVKLDIIPKGSYLLMENLDRMSRDDPWDAVSVLRGIIKSGIKVVTVANGRVYGEESAGSSGFELLEAVVVLIRAHEESATKSHRLKNAWASKRNKGAKVPLTGQCPAWFKLDKKAGKFIILPDRKLVVKRIFEEYLQGKGTHGIAEGLNREGVEPFGSSSFWHRSYVMKILDNPSVIGRFTPHITDYVDGKKVRRPQQTIENYFPSVVEPEVFSRVQSMRGSRRSPSVKSSGKPQVSHLLAGLATCPKCSQSMIRVNKGSATKRGYPYLVCSRAKAGAGCEYHGVRIDKLEASLLERFPKLFKAPYPEGSSTLLDIENRLREERETIKKQVEPLVDFLAEGEVVGVRERLMKLEARLQIVREQEEELEILKASRNSSLVDKRLKELRGLIGTQEIDYVAANSAMRQVFKRVVIHWDLKKPRVDFHWLHGGVSSLPIGE